MTDGTLVAVPIEDQSTPRRTIRIPDNEWESGLAAAETNGETISAVIRRRVAEYVDGGAAIEYRATSHTIPSLIVENITGDWDDVRAHFPAKHWRIEGREVSSYRAAGRVPRVTNVVEHHT